MSDLSGARRMLQAQANIQARAHALKQARPKVRHRKLKPDAYKRIYALPNFTLIREKLCAGVSCESVAAYLQEQCRLALDVKRSGLIKQLFRFRETLPIIDRHTTAIPKLHEAVQEFTHRIDVLREQNMVYEYQLLRVGKLIALEEGMPNMVHPQLSEEMDRLMAYSREVYETRKAMGLHKPGQGTADDVDALIEQDVVTTGAIAVLEKEFGPQAGQVAITIGQKIHEAIRSRLVADRSVAHSEQVEVTSVQTVERSE